MTSMLILGFAWLALAVVVALPMARVLRMADERQVVDALVARLEQDLGDADHGPLAPTSGLY